MAWIRVVGEDEANDDLQAAIQAVKGSRGKLSNILGVHSLLPETMTAHMDLYTSIMFGPSGHSREEREMIAIVVSSANQCPYCIQHHAAALQHYWKDEARVQRFASDYRAEDLPERMRGILGYAAKLTTSPHDIREADIAGLRDLGVSDEDILAVNLITSYFNFVNRIALGLGVAFSEEEVGGYKY